MSIALLFGVAFAAVPTKLKPPEKRGENLYRAHCQACHGSQGLGDGPALAVLRTEAPPLAGRVDARPRAAAIDMVLYGRGDMPAYGSMMGLVDARDILLWLSRLDPETGLHPGKKPPKLQTPPAPSGGRPVPPAVQGAGEAELPQGEPPPIADGPIGPLPAADEPATMPPADDAR